MMPNNSGGCDNDTIQLLLKRELALKARLAAERVKLQQRREKERARLEAIIGKLLLDQAALTPDSDLMLRQILKTADIDERSRRFLAELGWL
jgi:hypothetical protein